MEYNIELKKGARRLQRRVSADRGMPLELVPAFENYARTKANEFLLDLDNWLASRPPDDSDADERLDAGVDVFFYAEPSAKEEPLAALLSDSETKMKPNG